VIDLGFRFAYFDTDYTQVSISSNGHVCLGNTKKCANYKKPLSYDTLIGWNLDLNTSLRECGQIYYKHLNMNFTEYVNVLDTQFVPTNVLMITYDNVLSSIPSLNSTVSFQIFLFSDSVSKKYFIAFKYKSCPNDSYLQTQSGLNYIINGKLQDLIIVDGQQCKGTNINKAGIWVSEVTSLDLSNFSFLFFSNLLKKLLLYNMGI
jgi:hypothetical protein